MLFTMNKKEICFKNNLKIIVSYLQSDNNSINFQVFGEINAHNSYEFQLQISNLVKNKKLVKFDCEGLTYISSSGIGALVFMKKIVNASKGKMEIINCIDLVKSVFSAMGVSDFLFE